MCQKHESNFTLPKIEYCKLGEKHREGREEVVFSLIFMNNNLKSQK